jgi:3-methylcrotonyl-CoA carboxylase alpha subunit
MTKNVISKIDKILIANRGEIALRVIKTCRDLGIRTVTLYTEEDKNLPHRFRSDEAFSLGQGTLAETYLNQERIIEIAKETGATAIHPGYGFLSENTEFCKRVSSAGLIFIGPSVAAIELMGDKKTSKDEMGKIGIPLIPGYHGENQDPEFLKLEADKIGYPVLIKATAGGGGKGMRIVDNAPDFLEALLSAKREALNAFSNDKVLLEKYIINPRHIEVQLVSDGQGNHFHFYERECSIQRRYQKVVEETPSPALDDKLRQRMCETAVKISEGINYVGAGTIEYILAPDNNFYFLEMNTRLQVEHPVTEMVTGFDLVKLQIEAAEGRAFSFKQSDITQTGHSIEVRIYAEDPDNDFLPTIGKIQKIGFSREEGVRLDCGFVDNNSISVNYDPMIAKLIVHSDDRKSAIYKMDRAIDDIKFSGVKTNRDYLKRILKHSKFIEGAVDTAFIETYREDLKRKELSDEVKAAMIAGALFSENTSIDIKAQPSNSWDTRTNFRNV